MKKITPLRAIRNYCLYCVCNQNDEVKVCSAVKCPLWMFRFGKLPSPQNIAKNPFLDVKNIEGKHNVEASVLIKEIKSK